MSTAFSHLTRQHLQQDSFQPRQDWAHGSAYRQMQGWDLTLYRTKQLFKESEKYANKKTHANPSIYGYAHCALLSEVDLKHYIFYCLRNLSLSM